MKSIGKTIASLRKKKGYTQQELAEKMNVTDKAVSKWERDLSYPDINTIARLADVLEVPVNDLLNTKMQNGVVTKNKSLVNLILKAVALAMGLAIIVLNALGQIDVKSSLIMLGIGLFSISLYLLGND